MRCVWCFVPLFDRAGQPRWEVFTVSGRAVFVCYDRCTGLSPALRRPERVLVTLGGRRG